MSFNLTTKRRVHHIMYVYNNFKIIIIKMIKVIGLWYGICIIYFTTTKRTRAFSVDRKKAIKYILYMMMSDVKMLQNYKFYYA